MLIPKPAYMKGMARAICLLSVRGSKSKSVVQGSVCLLHITSHQTCGCKWSLPILDANMYQVKSWNLGHA